MDAEDDKKAGIKSSAVILGSGVYAFLYICATIFVSMLAFAGVRNGHSPLYFALTVGGTAAHLVWQLVTLDITSPLSCRRSCRFLA
jgi:4-hydroxybenzoate polyprenyltransferase